MFDIIAIGDATLDTFLVIDEGSPMCAHNKTKRQLCLNYADKIPIIKSAQSVGGNAANVAAGMCKLGLKTAIVTELGADITGHIIAHQLEEAGVNTDRIRVIKNAETRYSVVLNYEAERTILSYHAPRKYKLPPLPKTRWIYYTSLGKSFERLQNNLSAYIRKHKDTRLAMNPGSYQLNLGIKKIREILPLTDILIVNKEEAANILGKKMPIPRTLRALGAKGVKTAVITDSTRGSYASGGKSTLFMPAYPIAPIAKTGAGDAYASGFMSAILSDKELDTAIMWGTANACGVIQKFGAHNGLLTRAGITKMMRKYKQIIPKTI